MINYNLIIFYIVSTLSLFFLNIYIYIYKNVLFKYKNLTLYSDVVCHTNLVLLIDRRRKIILKQYNCTVFHVKKWQNILSLNKIIIVF